MSEQIVSLLNDLSDAISAEEFEAAHEIATNLQQEYRNRREDERARVTNARTLFADPESASVGNIDDLQGVTQVDGGTRMTRSMLLISVSSLATSHEELRAEGELSSVVNTVEAAISELKAAEPELTTVSGEVDEIIENSDVPPSLLIQTASVKEELVRVNEEITISITVENVGERTASGVELSIQSNNNITANPDTFSLGSLESGQPATREVKVTSSRRGVQAVRVQISGDNANSDRSNVMIAVKAAKTVQDYATEEGVINTNGLRSAVSDWRADKISTDLLREVTDYWRSGETVT